MNSGLINLLHCKQTIYLVSTHACLQYPYRDEFLCRLFVMCSIYGALFSAFWSGQCSSVSYFRELVGRSIC